MIRRVGSQWRCRWDGGGGGGGRGGGGWCLGVRHLPADWNGINRWAVAEGGVYYIRD